MITHALVAIVSALLGYAFAHARIALAYQRGMDDRDALQAAHGRDLLQHGSMMLKHGRDLMRRGNVHEPLLIAAIERSIALVERTVEIVDERTGAP